MSGPEPVEHRQHVASLDDLLAALGLPRRPAFMADALCREFVDVVDFHAPKRSDPAKAVCQRCAVQAECLQWALDDPTLDVGDAVLGGTTPAERRALRRQQAADQARHTEGEGWAGSLPAAGGSEDRLSADSVCRAFTGDPGGGSDPCGPAGDPQTPAIRPSPSAFPPGGSDEN